MFGDLIVGYLFLGGLGGGTYLAWCALCLMMRRMGSEHERTLWRATPAILGFVLVVTAVGALCLLGESTRPGQAYLLLLNPTMSAVSVGFFALAVFEALVLALFALRTCRPAAAQQPGRAWLAVAAGAALAAAVVVVYAGVLLYEIRAVPFWATPLVPAMFAVSACSTGLAAASVLYALHCAGAPRLFDPLKRLAGLDVVLVAVELVVSAAMLVRALGDPAGAASVARLACGDLAPVFWLGWTAAGLLAPLVLQVVGLARKASRPAGFVVSGICVVVGGFCMRYCIIHAGIHMSAFMFAGIY